jgi:Peroxiredoxin
LKKLFYIFSIAILLFSCNRDDIYQIEGRLSNLENTTLYVVFESSEGNIIDTITCDEQGKFSIFREHIEGLQMITFYYNDRKNWFEVFPEADKPMQVKGDARYAQLLEVKGGRTNNKLSEFKKKAESLIKERTDLSSNSNDFSLSNREGIPQLANINYELRRMIQGFVAKNPKEEASAILISVYFSNPEEILQAEELINQLTPELDDFFIVKNLKSQIAKAKTTMIGANAPGFSVTNIYGKNFTNQSFTNKFFILAFTALWCDMCQTEVMMLDDIVEKYPKDSLDILLISLDEEFNEVHKLYQDSIDWNLVTDSAGQAIKLFETYNVSCLPKCFLIDKDGKIILSTANGLELQQAVDEVMETQ